MADPSPRSSALPCTARDRILDAIVLVVYERGYANSTVTQVCACAGVARGTFYESFEGLQDCFLAMMDDAYRRVHGLIEQAFDEQQLWQDGLRAALVGLLSFFDAHPRLARVWLIETLAAGTWALQRRERHVARLTSMIVRRWPLPDRRLSDQLAATSAMESVLALIRAHLLAGHDEPAISLLAAMMSLITSIYLGPAEAEMETRRCEALMGELMAPRSPDAPAGKTFEFLVPQALCHPRARRLRACLLHIASHSESSNREIAAAIGIGRDDQISTILARLLRLGLLVKRQTRAGHPNAWSLSPDGQRVALALRGAEATQAPFLNAQATPLRAEL